MAVQVNDFIIPESNYQGLNRMANTVERRNEREYDVARQQQANKKAGASFLTNYLDPKDHLTGTNYDPQIVKGFDDLLQQGIKLVGEGADTNTLMMALAPGVARLNEYSTKAKLVNQKIKEGVALLPSDSGYDKARLTDYAKKAAFYDSEGNLKDITTIDTDTNFISEAARLYPGEITTGSSIKEYVKSLPKFTEIKNVKRINSKGGYEMKRSKVTTPYGYVVDDEGEIVPAHDIALEGGKPHTFNFQTGKGTSKEAEIRLMKEKDFDSMLSQYPETADWLRGQLMKMGQSTNLNTPQAKNAARAIMYDELKKLGGGGIEEMEEVKDTPAPRVSIRVSSGSGTKGSDTDIRDVYKHVEETMTSSGNDIPFGKRTLPMNKLSATAQNIILKYANDLIGGAGNNKLTQGDIYIEKDKDGKLNIMDSETREVIAPIDFTDVNVPAQASVVEKRKVVQQGKENNGKKEDLRKKYNY